MKKQFFFSMLAAAAMFASCSSDDAVVENNAAATGENGFVAFTIQLPQIAGSTRAANDVFEDGTANEYKVTDATLLLFKGDNETAATFSSAYTLSLTPTMFGSTTDNITSTAKITQEINNNLTGSQKFYALVVLNNNGQFVVNPADHSLQVNSTSVLTSWTLADFIENTKISTSADKLYNHTTTEEFFMSNAPLSTVAGGSNNCSSADLVTLPEIDATKIYNTAAAAEANPATEVCVERAAAKVTLSSTAAALTGTTTGDTKAYTILGWYLDNTSKNSYLVRNMDGFNDWRSLFSNANPANKYRFAGANEVVSGYYRTYWGKDVNYNVENVTATSFLNYKDEKTLVAGDWLTVGTTSTDPGIAYCAENTFDVQRQKDINTTAAIVKVQFNGGSLFYTINNETGTFYDEADLENYVKAAFLGNTAIGAKLKADYPGSWSLTASDLTVTYTTLATDAGITKVKEIVIKGTTIGAGSDINASTYTIGGTNALALVNDVMTIRRYVGGVAYYPVLIKHFGDDLTPWKGVAPGPVETPTPTAGDIYPSANAAANYLGRYGVLRNNWYDIKVGGIKKVGTATVPTLGNTLEDEDDPDGPGNGGYDDDIDEYISVKINILSWAKRTQTVTL